MSSYVPSLYVTLGQAFYFLHVPHRKGSFYKFMWMIVKHAFQHTFQQLMHGIKSMTFFHCICNIRQCFSFCTNGVTNICSKCIVLCHSSQDISIFQSHGIILRMAGTKFQDSMKILEILLLIFLVRSYLQLLPLGASVSIVSAALLWRF